MEPLVIPNIYCPFPSLMSPLLDQAQRHTLEWAHRFHLDLGRAKTQVLLDCIRMVCRMYPKANLEELCICSDWIWWAALYDDSFDQVEPDRQVNYARSLHDRLLAAIEGSVPGSPQEPLAPALSDICQRAAHLTSPIWQKRFARHYAEWFAGNDWEAESENRAPGRIPQKDTLIEKEFQATALRVLFALIELVGHYDFSTELYESQFFQDLLHSCGYAFLWTNDVYSLQKELASGELFNLVVVIQHEERCSLQEAVNEVCALVAAETKRFQELVLHVPAYPDALDQALHAYVVDLGSWLAGHLDWERESLRYHTKAGYVEQPWIRSYLAAFPTDEKARMPSM